MKTQNVAYLILALLVLVAGGCGVQPPAKAQADFDAAFKLTTTLLDGRMVFLGVGGEIDGMTNPDLVAQTGDMVQVTLINGDGMPHDLAIPDLNVQTAMMTGKGQTAEVVFEISAAGEFAYYCTVSGHRQAGMEGNFIVSVNH